DAARRRHGRALGPAGRPPVGGAPRRRAGARPQRRARRGHAQAGCRLAPGQVRQGRRLPGVGQSARPRGGPRGARAHPGPAPGGRARPMTLVDTLQLVVLLAFAVINGTQLGGLVLAARALLMRDRRVSRLEETALTRASTYLPVSFLVAAYNEEATIVGSVRSLLGMHYPEYELIIVNDGSKDGTMRVLHEAFELVPTLASPRRITPHATVRGTWRSATHPSLTVIDKENGGRSDALNTALEQARYPIVVVIDADSLVDPQALVMAGTRFLDDPTLVADRKSVV